MTKCYLCGATGNITRDHIPPKGFFVPPLPDNLITVPCCDHCNQSYKKDDEAVRVFMSAYRWQSNKGFWIWKKKAVASTLKRSPKLRQKILDSFVDVPVQTENGVKVMSAITFPMDRMNRFMVRITKGLLLTYYPKIDYSNMHFDVQQTTPSQQLADYMFENLTYNERGDGAFRFWHAVAEDDPKYTGIWSYVFYDGLCFTVAHSMDKNDLASTSTPTR
jgi:hypothetical protein